MKAFLCFFAILMFVAMISTTLAPSVAQGSPDGGGGGTECSYCFCLSDAGCNGSDCANPGGCTTGTFTVPCTGLYHYVAKVICPDGSCKHCSACVDIFPGNPNPPECHNTHCDNAKCEEHCTDIPLEPGITYTMRVCLVPCPGNLSTCAECGANCVAYGCVYRNVTYECVPL